MGKQTLHAMAFASDSIGFAVGDSGTVLETVSWGRFWRVLPPEPLFMHPATAYTGIGFPSASEVFVAGNDRAYESEIRPPMYWHPHWRWPVSHTLSITEWPNPTSGVIHLVLRSTSRSAGFSEPPTLRICDVSGNTLSDVNSITQTLPGEWSAVADVTFLPANAYTAIATLGSEQAMCKFLVER